MEEYNPIDWGNIDGVKSEIDVHQEWLILQNNIRKKKKRHRYLLLFWPFLFCAMMAFYLFNTSNKENVLVSQSKITSEQKDSKSLTTNEKGSLLLTNNENNEQSSKSSENSSQEQKHITLGSAKSGSDQLIKNAYQPNKKTKQIASVSKDQTEISSISINAVSNENTNSENILNKKQNQEADVNSTKQELDQKNNVVILHSILEKIPILDTRIEFDQDEFNLQDRIFLPTIKKQRKTPFEFGIIQSIGIARNELSSTGSDLSNFVSKRERIEKAQEFMQLDLQIQKPLNKKLSIYSGIQMNQQTIQVKENQNYTVKEMLTNQPTEILVDRNGNKTTINSDVEVKVTKLNNTTFYNRYRAMNIPIGLNHKFYQKNNWSFGSQYELSIHLLRMFKGYRLDENIEASYYSINEIYHANQILDQFALGLYSQYAISKSRSMQFSIQYSRNLSSWNVYDHISEKFYRMNFGIAYFFK